MPKRQPKKPVYLDDAATSRMLPEVADEMRQVLAELVSGELGNPAALHSSGQKGKHYLERARLAVAKLINAQPSEIIFTSGGSEANNTVINVFSGESIAVSAVEHPSVLEPAKKLTKNSIIIPVDHEGRVKATSLIGGHPRLVSVMLANNELGTIQPVAELARHQHQDGHFIHTDATQAVGKIPVDVQTLGVDYLTFSAHKLGGPVGIGVLFVRQGAPYRALIFGGHQEEGRRAGTANALLAAGLGKAAELANERLPAYQKIAKLRDELGARILREVPHSSINSPSTEVLPNILNVSFQAAEGESIQLYLDLEGIMVSTGSACAAGDIKPSHVLMAARHDAEVAHSSIRFSLSPETSAADLESVMAVLPDIVKRLQGISTIKIQEEYDREL